MSTCSSWRARWPTSLWRNNCSLTPSPRHNRPGWTKWTTCSTPTQSSNRLPTPLTPSLPAPCPPITSRVSTILRPSSLCPSRTLPVSIRTVSWKMWLPWWSSPPNPSSRVCWTVSMTWCSTTPLSPRPISPSLRKAKSLCQCNRMVWTIYLTSMNQSSRNSKLMNY